jgi:MFS family permease
MLRNRSTLLFLAAVLVMGAGQTVVFAIVPSISRSIGLTEVESSLMFTVSSAMILLTSTLWGRAGDKLGRLPVVLFGLTAYGVLLGALAFILKIGLAGASASFVFMGCLICRGLHGALTAGILPAAQAELAENSDANERVGKMAAVSIAFGLGSLVGPSVVQMLTWFGALASLWFFSIIAVVLVAILASTQRNRKVTKAAKPDAAFKLTPQLIWCLIVSTCFYIAFLGTMQIAGFIVQDRFHYSATEAVSLASYSFLIIALSTILTQVVVVRLKSDRARLLTMSGAIAGVAAYGMALIDHGLVDTIIASVLLGVSLALILPSVSAVASYSTSAQGAALGAVAGTQALGFLIGPLLASYLYSIKHSLPLMVNAAILLACAMIATRLPSRLKPE